MVVHSTSGGAGYIPSPSIVQSNATSELVEGRCAMDKLEKGDLVRSEWGDGDRGIVLKVASLSINGNRVRVHWAKSGRQMWENIHALRKVSQ